MGLFDGEDDFLAVYVFYQISPDTFDCHFTSRRDASKDAVWAAGRQLVQFFTANNLRLSTHVAARNVPLRRWVESAGLVAGRDDTEKSGQDDTGRVLSSHRDTFVEYRSQQVNPHRVKRQKAKISGHDGDDGPIRLSDSA
jgi:hypothetical protein